MLLDWSPGVVAPQSVYVSVLPPAWTWPVGMLPFPVQPRVVALLATPLNSLSLLAVAASSQVLLVQASTVLALEASNQMSYVANLSVDWGEDVTLSYTMSPVVNITGWTIRFQLLASYGGTLVTTISASVVSGPSGTFSVTVPSATNQQTPATYVYTVARVDSGSHTMLANGNYVIGAPMAA